MDSLSTESWVEVSTIDGEAEAAASFSTSFKMSLAYLLTGVIGIVGNLAVIIIMMSDKKLSKKLTNIYIINQSFIDMAVGVILVASHDVEGAVPVPNLLGKLYCKLWVSKVFLWGLLGCSTCNLIVLTLERYMELVFPIYHKTSFSMRKVYLSLVLTWTVVPIYRLLYVNTCVIIDGQCKIYAHFPNPQLRTFFGISVVMILYFVPLLILVYAYSHIAYTLHKRIRQIKAAETSRRDDIYQRGRKNTIKTLLLVAVSFVICWTTNQMYFFLYNLGYEVSFATDFYHTGVVMVFCNSCANPFIYAFQYTQFQQAGRRLAYRIVGKNVNGLDMDMSDSTATKHTAD